MPASRSTAAKPRIQILTRRSGINATPWRQEQPLLEVFEVFRIDVLAEAFEGFPDAPHYVRFTFNQEQNNLDDWELYDPARLPQTPLYEPTPEMSVDSRDYDLDIRTMWDYAYICIFQEDCDFVEPFIKEVRFDALANSQAWRDFWRVHLPADGHQDMFTYQGLRLLHRDALQLHHMQFFKMRNSFGAGFEVDDLNCSMALSALAYAGNYDKFMARLRECFPHMRDN